MNEEYKKSELVKPSDLCEDVQLDPGSIEGEFMV